jgi:hypothetical protein
MISSESFASRVFSIYSSKLYILSIISLTYSSVGFPIALSIYLPEAFLMGFLLTSITTLFDTAGLYSSSLLILSLSLIYFINLIASFDLFKRSIQNY